MVFYKAKEHKVKITNEQIKRMIKEELDDLLTRSRDFGAYFHKLKDMMVASQEAYNQANEIFNQIKGSGILNPEEEETLQKTSDYASAWYKHKSAKDYLLSIKDFHPAMSMKREEISQWKQASKEVEETEAAMNIAANAFKYDRFSAKIMGALQKNNKG